MADNADVAKLIKYGALHARLHDDSRGAHSGNNILTKVEDDALAKRCQEYDEFGDGGARTRNQITDKVFDMLKLRSRANKAGGSRNSGER